MSNYTLGNFKDGSKGWKAVPYQKYKQVGFSTHEIHRSDDGECVAEIVHGEADATLIAAAPDLFEALVALKDYCKYHNILLGSGIVHQIDIAIEKAVKPV